MAEERSSLWHRLGDALRRPGGRSLVAAFVVLAVLLLGWWQASRWYETLFISD
jgi:hypothetical protein